MPKEFKAFQAEFAALDKKAKDIYAEDKAYGDSETQFKAHRMEAIEAITLRIQELKDGGRTGTSINDFLDDPELKTYHEAAVNSVASSKRNEERNTKNRESAKKLVADFGKLKAALVKEAAERKKKIIGQTSQSAPEMEKLAKTIQDILDKDSTQTWLSLKELAGPFKAPTPEKNLEAALTNAVKNTQMSAKGIQINQKLAQMKQSLNLRLLTQLVTKFRVEHGKAKAEAMAALKALVGGNPVDAKTHLNKAIDIVDAMDKTLQPLNAAAKEYKDFIADDPQGSKVIAALGQMTSTHSAALKEVAAVQQKVK